MIRISSKPSKLEKQKALLGGQVPVKKKTTPPTGPLQKPRDLDIDLADIRLDQAAQPREHLSTEKTAEYAEAMRAEAQFPPLVVFHDGKHYWLADGFHRHYAAQQAKRRHLRCLVHSGGLREAILYSVGANSDHGLPRTDEDKRRAVARLLSDEEWSQWSDREIARRCQVSDKFVAKQRPPASADDPQISRKVQRGGVVFTQKVAKKRPASLGEAADGDFGSAAPVGAGDDGAHLEAGVVANDGAAASVERLPDVSRVSGDGALIVSEPTAVLDEGEVETARPDRPSFNGQDSGSDDVLVAVHEVAPPAVDAPPELAEWLDGIDFSDKRKRAFVIVTPEQTYVATVWPRVDEGEAA